MILAGDGTRVSGSGSTPNPYVISAEVECDDVRPCISAGPGATYDPATGVVGADLSQEPGNNLVIRPDGLFVPTGAATVTPGCGLTGNGSASSPIRANTGAWQYECDLDDAASWVYCDSAGRLRGEPPVLASFQQNSINQSLSNPPLVPTAADVEVTSLQLAIVNPDWCRMAFAILFMEVDVGLTLPPNSGGMYGIAGDDMVYLGNGGTSTVTSTHVQTNKLANLTISPGATRTYTMPVTMGRGNGNARYSRIQATLRAWVFSIPTP